MDMNCDYKHELVVHGCFASEAVAMLEVVIAVDDSVIVSVDNNIHFDYEAHPKVSKEKVKFRIYLSIGIVFFSYEPLHPIDLAYFH